jgi:hypothetical protein
VQGYARQRFYAERAAQIKMPKTIQIGVEDKLTISTNAATKMAASSSAHTVLQKTKEIYYEDPRIKIRRAKMAMKAEQSARAGGFADGFIDLFKAEFSKNGV